MKIVIFNEWEDNQDVRRVLGVFDNEKVMNEAIDTFMRQRGFNGCGGYKRVVDGVEKTVFGELWIEDCHINTLYMWGVE